MYDRAVAAVEEAKKIGSKGVALANHETVSS
jgi:hypothetical protein